jgi:hypothetical protein
MPQDVITIVSGLPRSGTSLMMQVLEAGGLPLLKDDIREADADNPKGYYEFERVKQVAQDPAWLKDARGKGVKMVSALLLDLPNTFTYRVVFMRRKMDEVLASQKTMLQRSGKPTDAISDEKMAALFRKHLSQVESGSANSPMQVLYVSYNEMIADPIREIERIGQFWGMSSIRTRWQRHRSNAVSAAPCEYLTPTGCASGEKEADA